MGGRSVLLIMQLILMAHTIAQIITQTPVSILISGGQGAPTAPNKTSAKGKAQQAICRAPSTTLFVPAESVASYLRQGDTLGPCGASSAPTATTAPSTTLLPSTPSRVEICITAVQVTATVLESDLERALQVAARGPCVAPTTTPEIAVCFPLTMTAAKVSASDLPSLLAKGVLRGPCPATTAPSNTTEPGLYQGDSGVYPARLRYQDREQRPTLRPVYN